MSYDVHMEIDTGDTEPTLVEEVGNYTCNVAPMFWKALGVSLYLLDGRTGAEAGATLAIGITKMEAEPALYQAMSPENGWGDYEGALRYLRSIANVCHRHHKATLRIT